MDISAEAAEGMTTDQLGAAITAEFDSKGGTLDDSQSTAGDTTPGTSNQGDEPNDASASKKAQTPSQGDQKVSTAKRIDKLLHKKNEAVKAAATKAEEAAYYKGKYEAEVAARRVQSGEGDGANNSGNVENATDIENTVKAAVKAEVAPVKESIADRARDTQERLEMFNKYPRAKQYSDRIERLKAGNSGLSYLGALAAVVGEEILNGGVLDSVLQEQPDKSLGGGTAPQSSGSQSDDWEKKPLKDVEEHLRNLEAKGHRLLGRE